MNRWMNVDCAKFANGIIIIRRSLVAKISALSKMVKLLRVFECSSFFPSFFERKDLLYFFLSTRL